VKRCILLVILENTFAMHGPMNVKQPWHTSYLCCYGRNAIGIQILSQIKVWAPPAYRDTAVWFI